MRSLLASPTGRTVARARAALELDPALRGVELTAEVGPAPLELHRLAFADPGRWMDGAEAVLIGALADQRLFTAVTRDAAEHWAGAFPGLPPPAVLW
jgi:hypothetical protein